MLLLNSFQAPSVLVFLLLGPFLPKVVKKALLFFNNLILLRILPASSGQLP
jgi:hypothetical protein